MTESSSLEILMLRSAVKAITRRGTIGKSCRGDKNGSLHVETLHHFCVTSDFKRMNTFFEQSKQTMDMDVD